MTERIGFIGVGLMGHGMAKNLLAKGHPLTFVAHRNRANLQDLLDGGAREAKSADALAEASDIVFLCVTGSPQVEANVYGERGLLAACRSGTMVVDCSTSEPDSTLRIRADFAAKGVEFVDAPLARTPREADMRLIRKPKKPRWRPFLQINFNLSQHDSWKHFIDLAYWNVELGEDAG